MLFLYVGIFRIFIFLNIINIVLNSKVVLVKDKQTRKSSKRCEKTAQNKTKTV